MPENIQPGDAFRRAEQVIRESIWATEPWRANAQLEVHGDWYPYVAGYKDAADKVVEAAINDFPDNLVYPIMFLYRHYLEIMIKQMLREFRSLQPYLKKSYGNTEYNPKLPTEKDPIVKHNLMSIWKELRELIEESWSNEENLSFLVDVEHRIKEFHDIDQGSVSFRYLVDKENNPIFQFDQEIRKVNVVQVKRVVDAITTRFGGALDKLDYQREILKDIILEHESALQDIRSEYESEMRWASGEGFY